MMKNENLLEGSILKVLFRLAMPLMGISFVEMAYSLVDTMWLGRLSTAAVAAVGGVHIFVWLAHSIVLIGRTGLSVGMSQAYGKGDDGEARDYLAAGFQVSLFLAILVGGTYFFARNYLLGFYRLSPDVYILAEKYLKIIAVGMIFFFFNPMLSAIFVSKGNSITPFKVSALALILNMILDPILIFGWSFVPALGVAGAAYATVFAQAFATFAYIYILIVSRSELTKTNFIQLKSKYLINILTIGVPTCLQSMVHALVGLVLNRYISGFGSSYIAVYAIGSQVESISWMTAEGYAVAVSAFTGQNYGAERYERIHKGYLKSMMIMGSLGIFATIGLFFFGKDLFEIFVPNDPQTIVAGALYLRILSLSQFFMILEIVTSGTMNGLALTRYPSFVAVLFNILRIPMAFLLMPLLGVAGIWWAMSVSSIFKGLGIYGFYKYIEQKTSGFSLGMSRYMSKKEMEL